MSERRMNAYYYGFDKTGVDAVDKILGAVACAGKAYHHTSQWADDVGSYDDHTGSSPVDWVQNAAIEAASRITELEALLKARDGGGHEMRCMFNNAPPSEENYCTCGHDAVAKYFEGVGK